MRIALLSTLYPPYILGGAEHSTRLLVRLWQQLGHEVLVVTTSDHDESEVMDGAQVVRLKNRNIYWRYPQRDKPLALKTIWHAADTYFSFYARRIRSLLRDFVPDVIVTGNLCGISPTIWKTCHRMHVPVVHTLRDYYLLCPVQTMTKNGLSCQKQCFICLTYSINKKRMSRYVDAVVGISQDILRRHLQQGYFPNSRQQTVIPNSVPNIPAIVRQTHHTIGFMGRLSPEKGIEFLIQAFLQSSLSERYVLYIAGDGNAQYKQLLIEKYSRSSVRFVGQQNANTFLQSIDLLIVPSLWNEPFGRVVIEAYAAHCPVLLANNGGLAELQRDGISWAFPTDFPAELVSLLDRFGQGELAVREEAFDDVMRDFDETTVAQSYIDLFQSLTKHE